MRGSCAEGNTDVSQKYSTRAKENIYLFSEKGERTKKGQLYTATPALASADYTYD